MFYVVLNDQNQTSSDSKNTLFLFTNLYRHMMIIIIKPLFKILYLNKLHSFTELQSS